LSSCDRMHAAGKKMKMLTIALAVRRGSNGPSEARKTASEQKKEGRMSRRPRKKTLA